MKALVYTAANEVTYRDEPQPSRAADEVLIRIDAVGICGSDMHAYHGHDPRRVPPLILGHELAGEILEGPGAGRRVTVNPLITCGALRILRAGTRQPLREPHDDRHDARRRLRRADDHGGVERHRHSAGHGRARSRADRAGGDRAARDRPARRARSRGRCRNATRSCSAAAPSACWRRCCCRATACATSRSARRTRCAANRSPRATHAATSTIRRGTRARRQQHGPRHRRRRRCSDAHGGARRGQARRRRRARRAAWTGRARSTCASSRSPRSR